MELHQNRDRWKYPKHIRILKGCACTGRPARAYDCIVVCTQQIQFWKIAAVTFDILYILCTLNRVLRPILGDRFILMCRSWYSGVDLFKFHGQSKLFSHIYFLCFLGNHSSAAPEKKRKKRKKRKKKKRKTFFS